MKLQIKLTTKERLLYELTGTETPVQLTEREKVLIDKCLKKINDLETYANELEQDKN